MYICYNSFFDENPYRDGYDGEYIAPVCPYIKDLMRQMPPPPPVGGAGLNTPGVLSGKPSYNAPSSPPPAFTPSKAKLQVQQQIISDGAIRPCRFKYAYIWLNNGRSFWAWLVYVDRKSASGWRWNGRMWIYFGIDLRKIESFICY